MIQNEEKIIKAIKYELLGMCLDKDLEKEIDFHKKSIFSKLTEKYGFSIEEMNYALKRYQTESQDPYLFPFEFSQKSYFPSSKLIPLNEIISFSEYFTKNIDISRAQSGGRFYNITFKSSSALDYIANLENVDIFLQKCPNCLSSFLRGVFLACGKISDPGEQYSLDFSLGDRSIMFADILSEYGIVPLISYKKSGTVVYFKNSSMIEEFCALAGLNRVVFALLNSKAESEIKQNINRRINCETNNIAKAVDAAAKQLKVISRLESANLLSSLPEELEQTARLRLENSDLTLAQLAAISIPPISKPGLAHRLKKIVELGGQLLEDYPEK